MERDMYVINPAACIVLTRKHRPNYHGDPKINVNSGLPAGKTYTLKEYMEFRKERKKK